MVNVEAKADRISFNILLLLASVQDNHSTICICIFSLSMTIPNRTTSIVYTGLILQLLSESSFAHSFAHSFTYSLVLPENWHFVVSAVKCTSANDLILGF